MKITSQIRAMSEYSDENLPRLIKQKIERNRQNAIIRKRSKLVSHPYTKRNNETTIKIGTTRYKNTGDGFLLEEEPDTADANIVAAPTQAPIFEPDRPTCEICNKQFATSWLFDNFTLNQCDVCRNPEIHKLITKTEAKNTYLLNNCDLDKRGPSLKFIQRKNPHNVRWGDVKLYLQFQVKERALEVWGSEKKIEEEKERREEKWVLAKSNKYQKHLKALRKEVRSSLYDRTTSASHTHEFGPEMYSKEEDTYHHKCTTCPYEEIFEKM